MTTSTKHIVSVFLATATLALVIPPVVESLNFVLPSFRALLAQIGIVTGSEAIWIPPVFGTTATVLGISAFIVSWRQGCYLTTGLLVASGIIYTIGSLLTTLYLIGLVIPGPILGVISGLGMLGLGIARVVRAQITSTLITK